MELKVGGIYKFSRSGFLSDPFIIISINIDNYVIELIDPVTWQSKLSTYSINFNNEYLSHLVPVYVCSKPKNFKRRTHGIKMVRS